MVALLSKCEEQYDIQITFSVETEPLGTGASLDFARLWVAGLVSAKPSCPAQNHIAVGIGLG